MTEQEWLYTENWLELWHYSDEVDRRTERKTLLFAFASCSHVAHYLRDHRSRLLLECSERFADGAVGQKEWENVCVAAQEASDEGPVEHLPHVSAVAMKWLSSGSKVGRAVELVPDIYGYEAAIKAEVLLQNASDQEAKAIWYHPIFLKGRAVGERMQADLLREVIGNPFRPVSLNPAWVAWNDGTVRRIAQAIYDDRAFDQMPVLADALEDAGCDNADILNHCRNGGEHVRGCWVVDLLLGKQ